MSTMNISLPDSLKSFVDEQVTQRGYGTSSEYVRELIRRDQDRLQLRNLLLAGASSAPAKAMRPIPSAASGSPAQYQRDGVSRGQQEAQGCARGEYGDAQRLRELRSLKNPSSAEKLRQQIRTTPNSNF
jgi:antitoxin ParD1/3/4